MRKLFVAGLIALALPAAAQTVPQDTLAGFFAAADGREKERLDDELALCIVEHAGKRQTNKLVKLAAADDQEGFVKLLQKVQGKKPKLTSCMEGAAFAAMMMR